MKPSDQFESIFDNMASRIKSIDSSGNNEDVFGISELEEGLDSIPNLAVETDYVHELFSMCLYYEDLLNKKDSTLKYSLVESTINDLNKEINNYNNYSEYLQIVSKGEINELSREIDDCISELENNLRLIEI